MPSAPKDSDTPRLPHVWESWCKWKFQWRSMGSECLRSMLSRRENFLFRNKQGRDRHSHDTLSQSRPGGSWSEMSVALPTAELCNVCSPCDQETSSGRNRRQWQATGPGETDLLRMIAPLEVLAPDYLLTSGSGVGETPATRNAHLYCLSSLTWKRKRSLTNKSFHSLSKSYIYSEYQRSLFVNNIRIMVG